MFILTSTNRRTTSERPLKALATRLASAVPLTLCLVALTCAPGCASSSRTAASNNARGVEYFTAGDYDNAIARFQDSLEENPDSAETYYNLGSALQRKANETGDLNLLAKAEDAYWTALQMNPAPETIVCCYRGIATSETARGDSASAMQTLEEWRDRNPDSIEPRLEIAYLLEAQERDDDAYDALKEIAEMAPNDYRAYYKMGVLSERAGDLDDAVEQTKVAAQLTSNSEITQRARSLEAQFAAKRRNREKEESGGESTSTESALAIGVPPGAQTTRVQSTSAQTESETVPELVLPPEETPQPVETPIPEARPISSSQQLGFGEVVVLSRSTPTDQLAQNTTKTDAKPTRTNATRFVQNAAASSAQKDSDVRWISATSTDQDNKVAQTSASIPQKTTKNAPNSEEERKRESATTTDDAPDARRAAIVGSLHRKSDNYEKPKKQPTEMGSGFPRMKAGSFF